MSDQTTTEPTTTEPTTTEPTTTEPTTNDRKPTKAKKSARSLEHKDAIAAFAKARGMRDLTAAGKQYRSLLRRNFDVIAKSDPAKYGAKGKVKQHANDGRPWGPMRADVLRKLGAIK